nr:selenide, water dikinase SelD [Pseudoprimorskyibacter insulae]
MQTLPLTKDLVLIGGGHAHALVLRMWGMNPLPGARVTVINPGPSAPYSGMLPGFVAGHYGRDDLDIDLVRLARFAGARVILGAVDGIDLSAGTVHVLGRPPIGFDVASVDVGISSEMPSMPGFMDHAIPAKPLGPFAAKWDAFRQGKGPARVAVIGGGVAGAELAMAMAHALHHRGRFEAVTLIDQGKVLSVLGAGPRAKALAALARLRVNVIENAEVQAIEPGAVLLADGRRIEGEFINGAAGARPWDWIGGTGLDLHEGFIKVDAQLRSSDPRVFAAGDCAHLTESPRPKAGVFAVRQAPVLLNNLKAALGAGRMKPYRPQKDYLKLISLGGREALAEKKGLPLAGPLMWTWKNHIDQKFMRMFRDYPSMHAPTLPKIRAAGGEALAKPLCAGCGSKLGKAALSNAVAGLPKWRHDVHPLPGDDAAMLWMEGIRQVVTVDHLSALTDDPALMTEIAAIHALGDVWAMGAQPQAALAQIVVPRMSPALQERTLSEIMEVAGRVMQAAGAEIIGGHSTMGAGMTIGFTVTGLLDRQPIALSGAQPGDALILTKPIGTGVLMAAEMAGKAKGAWVANAFASMVRPQSDAARILAEAHAMTDVTGFGLAGHLAGICEASGTGAVLRLADIPVLDGAVELLAQGIESSLFEDNRALVPGLPDKKRARLLFDPQTCGGLLAAVDAADAKRLLSDLKKSGYQAAIIGRITDQPGWYGLD